MSKKHTEAFVGQPPNDPTEKKFLRQLRLDLERLEVPALVLANLEVGRRQVDFVIATPFRTVQCELKGFHWPVVGHANGLWVQIAPSAERRTLDTNPGRQAKELTFALGDQMKRFARKVPVPLHEEGSFYRGIDTVVCVFPEIPAGSEIDKHPHVTFLGYPELLTRLATDGPRMPWANQHWLAFIRHLGLYRPEDLRPAARQAREQRAVADDYARRFADAHARDLEPIVATSARVDGCEDEPLDLTARLLADQVVSVVGLSGVGKTLRGRKAAVELAERGDIPIWLGAADYDPERSPFETLLGRAVGPFTTGSAGELLSSAAASGRTVAVILDGLNECPPAARGELLAAVGGLRLNHKAAVLISSIAAPDLPETLRANTKVELALPAEEEKEMILRAHDAEELASHSEAFATPFELVTAAGCFRELDGVPTRASVLDAYVRKLAPSEGARHALRFCARRMHSELRGSLPVQDTLRALQREEGVSSEAIDVAIESRLLRVTQGRLAFRHESLVRFLAAEALLIDSSDATVLAGVLSMPANAELRADALALESADRAEELLVEIADQDVLIAAATGELGEACRQAMQRVTEGIVTRAKAVTASARIGGPIGAELEGRVWETGYMWSSAEMALLTALGRALHRGHTAQSLIELFDETDARCVAALERYDQTGSAAATSAIVASTYAMPLLQKEEMYLPATLIFKGCESVYLSDRRDSDELAVSLVAGAGERSWGRLMIATKLFHRFTGSAYEAMSELLEKAWASRAYHPRLAVLQLAHDMAWRIKGPARERVKETLQRIDTNHWAMGSCLVEALDAYGLVDGRPLDDVEREIADVLALEDTDPEADGRAQTIVSNIFEPEGIVGSYSEAIEALEPEERRKLYVRATRTAAADDISMNVALRELERAGDLSDPEVQAPFLRMLVTPDPASWHGAQWGIGSCLVAVGACAQFAPEPPEPAADVPGRESWRVIFGLLFWLEHDRVQGTDSTEPVQELLGEFELPAVRRGAAALLHMVRASDPWRDPDGLPAAHDRLLEQHAGEFAELFRWSLDHRPELISPSRWHGDDLSQYLVKALGEVGDESDLAALRSRANDPALASSARAAVRQIEERLTPTI
jgi:hypothetical protein